MIICDKYKVLVKVGVYKDILHIKNTKLHVFENIIH